MKDDLSAGLKALIDAFAQLIRGIVDQLPTGRRRRFSEEEASWAATGGPATVTRVYLDYDEFLNDGQRMAALGYVVASDQGQSTASWTPLIDDKTTQHIVTWIRPDRVMGGTAPPVLVPAPQCPSCQAPQSSLVNGSCAYCHRVWPWIDSRRASSASPTT